MPLTTFSPCRRRFDFASCPKRSALSTSGARLISSVLGGRARGSSASYSVHSPRARDPLGLFSRVFFPQASNGRFERFEAVERLVDARKS